MILFLMKNKKLIYINFINFKLLTKMYKTKIIYNSLLSIKQLNFNYFLFKLKKLKSKIHFLQFTTWITALSRPMRFLFNFFSLFVSIIFIWYVFQEFYTDLLCIIEKEWISYYNPDFIPKEEWNEDSFTMYSWYGSRYWLYNIDQDKWTWVSYTPVSFTLTYTCVLIFIVVSCFACFTIFPFFFVMIREHYLFCVGVAFFLLCSSFWPDWKFFREFERWEFLEIDFPLWFYGGQFYGYGDGMTRIEWFNIYFYAGLAVSSDYLFSDLEFAYWILFWISSNVGHMDIDDDTEYREFLITDENVNLILDEGRQERHIFWYTKNTSTYLNFIPKRAYDAFFDIQAIQEFKKIKNITDEKFKLSDRPTYFIKHYKHIYFFHKFFKLLFGKNYSKRQFIGIKGMYTIPFSYWIDYTKKMNYFKDSCLINNNINLNKINSYYELEANYDFFFQTYINYWEHYSWKHRFWYTDWVALGIGKTLFIPPHSFGFIPASTTGSIWYSKFQNLYLLAIKLNKEQNFIFNINQVYWFTNLFKLKYFENKILNNGDKENYQNFIKLNLPKVHKFKYDILLKKHISLFSEMDFTYASKNAALWERLNFKKYISNNTFLTSDWDGFSRIFTLGFELIRLQSFRLYYHESQYAKDGQNYISNNWKIKKNTSSQLYQYYDWILNGPIIKYVNNNYDDRIYPPFLDPQNKGVDVVVDVHPPKDLVPWEIYNSDICESWVHFELKSKIKSYDNFFSSYFYILQSFSHEKTLLSNSLSNIFRYNFKIPFKDCQLLSLKYDWLSNIIFEFNDIKINKKKYLTEKLKIKEILYPILLNKFKRMDHYILHTKKFDLLCLHFNKYSKFLDSHTLKKTYAHGILLSKWKKEKIIFNYKLYNKILKFKNKKKILSNQINSLMFNTEQVDLLNFFIRSAKYYYYKNKKYLFNSLFHKPLVKPFIDNKFTPFYYESIFSKNRVNPLRRDFSLFSTVENKKKIEKMIKHYRLPAEMKKLKKQKHANEYLKDFEYHWKREYYHSDEYYYENQNREKSILEKIKKFEEISKKRKLTLSRWNDINNILDSYELYPLEENKYINHKNKREIGQIKFPELPKSWLNNFFLTEDNTLPLTHKYTNSRRQTLHKLKLLNSQHRFVSNYDNITHTRYSIIYGYNTSFEDKGYTVQTEFNKQCAKEWFNLSKEAPGFYHGVEYSPLDPFIETSVGGDSKEMMETDVAEHPDMNRDLFIQRHSFIRYRPSKFIDIKHSNKRQYRKLLNFHNFPNYISKLLTNEKKYYSFINNNNNNSNLFQFNIIFHLWNYKIKINNIWYKKTKKDLKFFNQPFSLKITDIYKPKDLFDNQPYINVINFSQFKIHNFIWHKTTKNYIKLNTKVPNNDYLLSWINVHFNRKYNYSYKREGFKWKNKKAILVNSKSNFHKINSYFEFLNHITILSKKKNYNANAKINIYLQTCLLNKIKPTSEIINIKKFSWQCNSPHILNFLDLHYQKINYLNNKNTDNFVAWNLSNHILSKNWQTYVLNWDWTFSTVYHQIIEFTNYNFLLGFKKNKNIEFPNLYDNHTQLFNDNFYNLPQNKFQSSNSLFSLYYKHTLITKISIKNPLFFSNKRFFNFLPFFKLTNSTYSLSIISYSYLTCFSAESKYINYKNWFYTYLGYFKHHLFTWNNQFFNQLRLQPKNDYQYINYQKIFNHHLHCEKIRPKDFKWGIRYNVKNWNTQIYPINWKYETIYNWRKPTNFINSKLFNLRTFKSNFNLFDFYKSNRIYKNLNDNSLYHSNQTFISNKIYKKLHSFVGNKFSKFFNLPKHKYNVKSLYLQELRKNSKEKVEESIFYQKKKLEEWTKRQIILKKKKDEEKYKPVKNKIKKYVKKKLTKWQKEVFKIAPSINLHQPWVEDSEINQFNQIKKTKKFKKFNTSNLWSETHTLNFKNKLIITRNPFTSIYNTTKNKKWLSQMFSQIKKVNGDKSEMNRYKYYPINNKIMPKFYNHISFVEKLNKLSTLCTNYNFSLAKKSQRNKLSNYLNLQKLQTKTKKINVNYLFINWNSISPKFSFSSLNLIMKTKVHIFSYWNDNKKTSYHDVLHQQPKKYILQFFKQYKYKIHPVRYLRQILKLCFKR